MKVLIALLCLASSATASDYEVGMEARRRGDQAAARAAFERLLSSNPSSGGALEGLALVSLAEGRNEDALGYLERWESKADSAYVQSLKATAYSRLGRSREQAGALLQQAQLDPVDLRPLRRADLLLRDNAPGAQIKVKVYKSLSNEGLETASPQRVAYEGRSIASEVRAGLGRGLSAVGGVSVRQEAQRNDTRGFTYYDILEHVDSLRLEGRAPRSRWSAQYGQSFLSDIHGMGVGRRSFSRVHLRAEADVRGAALRVDAARTPYFLRGAGASGFFSLLRESSLKAEIEAPRWGWTWLGRGAVYDYTSNVTLRAWSLLATKELKEWLTLQPGYARSFQEYYGAGVDGRLAVMPYDRWSLRARTEQEERWRAALSYGHAVFRDGNRLNEVDASCGAEVPRIPGLTAGYRFRLAEFAAPVPAYRSTDERAHWIGPAWKKRWAVRSLWTTISYEHGWLNDFARGDYEGNAWTAEVEWFRGRAWSLQALGRLANTSARDESYSASLQARWSF